MNADKTWLCSPLRESLDRLGTPLGSARGLSLSNGLSLSASSRPRQRREQLAVSLSNGLPNGQRDPCRKASRRSLRSCAGLPRNSGWKSRHEHWFSTARDWVGAPRIGRAPRVGWPALALAATVFVTVSRILAAPEAMGDAMASAAQVRFEPAPTRFEPTPAVAPVDGEGAGLTRILTRSQLLEEVAAGWRRPGPQVEPARQAEPPSAGDPLRRKLEEIVLPQISFTRAAIGRVVAALSAAAEEFDGAAEGMKGINIVLVDPGDAQPLVTLTLRHASLKRVLDFVTAGIGYQYEIESDAVVIRPGDGTSHLETRIFPVSRATAMRMAGIAVRSGPGAESKTDDDPAAMQAFLQQAGINFGTEGASLAYDGTALIVTQTTRNLTRIANLLARYATTRQVEIEAKFMEVQEGALEELGIQWNLSRRGIPQLDPATGEPLLDGNGRQVFLPQETYTNGGLTRSLAGAFPSSTNNPAITIDSAAVAGTTANGVTTPGVAAESRVIPVAPPAIPGSVMLGNAAGALGSISGFVGEFDVSAIIRALAQKQGTDLLSSPRLTVLSGSQATITVAQELRYPQSYGEIQSQVGSGSGNGTGISAAGVTVTAGTPQDFATRNIGVELKVTPTVEEDGRSISLDLNPKVTEFEGFVEYGGPSIAISSGVTVKVPPGFYQPIFSVRDISTRVTIWDGATLVMGGLTREEVRNVDDKVPILGDLPLVGRLFRSKGESAQKRNLLIFVTASLVSPGGGPVRRDGEWASGGLPGTVIKDP